LRLPSSCWERLTKPETVRGKTSGKPPGGIARQPIDGYPPAQNNLGTLYAFGAGVPKNLEEAVRWYRLAAEQGSSSARANLAREFTDGSGEHPDYGAAYFWALLAQSNQSDIAGSRVEEVIRNARSRISAEEAAALEAKVDDWRRNHPLSEQGWYRVDLSTGPCYITVNPVSIAPQ
jgi:hypothetical protein